MKTYVFRPLPSDNKGWLRYNGGDWVPDDGKPDLAFARPGLALFAELPHLDNILWSWRDLDEKHRYRWHYALVDPALNDTGNPIETSWIGGVLPNAIAGNVAMNKASKLSGGGSSGDGPRTYGPNEWIEAGLLWTIGSESNPDELVPVKAPENPVCYLCLDDKRGHKLNDLYSEHSRRTGALLHFSEEKAKLQARIDKIEGTELPYEYRQLCKAETQIKELGGNIPESEEGLDQVIAEVSKTNDLFPSRT